MGLLLFEILYTVHWIITMISDAALTNWNHEELMRIDGNMKTSKTKFRVEYREKHLIFKTLYARL